MKHDNYALILKELKELKKIAPKTTFGKHLSTIFTDKETWYLSDKSILERIQEYKNIMLLDEEHNISSLEEIIEEGMHLHTIFEEEYDKE